MPAHRRCRIRFAGCLAILICWAFGPAQPAFAADGDPMGTGTTPFDLGGSNTDRAQAVVVQPDGKVVVAGTVETGVGQVRPALARFLEGGGLDPTFGTAGKLVDPLATGFNCSAAALQLGSPLGLGLESPRLLLRVVEFDQRTGQRFL